MKHRREFSVYKNKKYYFFMEELKFSDATIEQLEELFSLVRIESKASDSLTSWLQFAQKENVNEQEKKYLTKLQRHIQLYVRAWNEVELETKFIGPVLMLTDFDEGEETYFLERSISAVYEGKTLYGKVDGMIAKGKYSPQSPYFCMQEYKRTKDPQGDPEAQVLAAMLAAQTLNENKMPIYGLYITGVNWSFVTLENKSYSVSESFGANGNDIFMIFKLLKALKTLIKKNTSS